MLILFDIDGTILLTQGAGIAAMVDAGRELFGGHFTCEGVDFSGRLDTLIWDDLARINSINDHHKHHDRFRAGYGKHLRRRFENGNRATLLPGVAELVQALANRKDVTVGLLTGNYPETGRLKIETAGLDPEVFVVAAWGCDGKTRRDLTPVAMKQHSQRSGKQTDPTKVVVIGDTPHDVDCAKAHGCRAIGVATGLFSVETLQQSGADLAVADLSGTEQILEWMLGTKLAQR